MVSGYNNWGRIRRAAPAGRGLRAASRRTASCIRTASSCSRDGPYSAVPAADLGLDEAAWKEMSLVIRREHECTHYFTRRLFGSMRNNLLDELIADYAGITAALGHFRADWCLRFLTARLEIYRGKPPLSDGAFRVLPALLEAAAENLERFEGDLDQPAMIAALASLRLEDLGLSRGRSAFGERSRRGAPPVILLCRRQTCSTWSDPSVKEKKPVRPGHRAGELDDCVRERGD